MRIPGLKLDLRGYGRIWPYLRPYKWQAFLAMFSTMPVGLLDATAAYLLRPFMDSMVAGASPGSSREYLFPLLIIVVTVVQGAFRFLSTYLSTRVGMRFSMDVKAAMFRKLTRSESAFFDKSSSGAIVQKFSRSADSACKGLLAQARRLIVRLTSSASLLAVMFVNSWLLSMIAMAVLVIAVFPLTRVRKYMRQLRKDTERLDGNLLSNYIEAFNGNRVISVYNLHDAAEGRLLRALRRQYGITMKLLRRNGTVVVFMHLMVAVGIASALWLQGYLIATKHMTPGNFVSFITALIMLYNPLKNMGESVNGLYAARLALDRVLGVLDRTSAIENRPNAIPFEAFRHAIAYEDVSFEYLKKRPVLKNVSFIIPKGQITAFVGGSGGGKTTLVSLLPRLYDVRSGRVAIDGVDVRDYDLESLRGAMSVVFQDNFLFAGTIRENILLSRPGATEEELDAAVRGACLDEFVSSLKDGLDTVIGERGVLLSGGQRQRVAIARAFIRNAPIVILDEATSALDNKSERIVQAAMDNLMKGKTVLVIAHRLSTVINAKKILVVHEGRIAESGTHDELLTVPNGIYAGLYRSDFARTTE